MAPLDVSVQVLEEFDGLVSGQWLRRVAEVVFAVEPTHPESSLSVVIADDDLVSGLNKQHRGLDENTDVLAFSFTHQGEYYGEREPGFEPSQEIDFALPPGQQNSLGEVIISYPQAQRQAAEAGHPIERELAVLLTHGVLHLLGHDHQGPEGRQAMESIEAQVVAQVRAEG